MRRLPLLAFLLVSTVAFAANRAQTLETLKRNFPSHISGPVTPKSDPLIQECFNAYRKRVSSMTMESLADDINDLRRSMEIMIARYEYLSDRSNSKDPEWKLAMQTPSMRAAIAANLSWLKSKMRPYVARLESFQRGNGL